MGESVVVSAETNGVETYYTYGLERISAQTGKTRTEYVYDGRGSVAAEVSYNNAWYTLGGILSSTATPTAISTATVRRARLPPPMPQGGGCEQQR